MAVFEFIDNGSSVKIKRDSMGYISLRKNSSNLILDVPLSGNDRVLNIQTLGSTKIRYIVNLDTDTIEGVGSGSQNATELHDALDELFFLDENSNGGGNVIDGDVYLNNLFEVEKDAQGNIIKTKSIYDFQVPPESIEVGESIKISDLGQSLSYSTKFDGKQYLLIGYEITSSGTQRPFVKELQSPTEFEVQPLFDESQTFITQKVFPIISLQDVIGKTYNLKAETDSDIFRVRLIRRATNGGEDTIIVDETIPGTQTNINGFDFDLSPITDFTINTDYDLVLSVNEGDTFEVLGSSAITGTFIPYIKRQFGWEYTKKDLAYYEDLLGFISSSEKGQPNGVAPLNDQGKIDAQYIDVDIDGGIEVIGYWDADTNTPDLSSLTLTKGQAYQVSVAGDTTLNGYTTWNEFDLAIWGDNIAGNWVRVVSTEKVLSVNGKKGEVVIDKTDVGLDQVDNTSDQDKPLSDATINALANKVDVGGNITDLNNDAGFIDSVLVDGVTVLGDGKTIPLSSVGGGNASESTLLKTNIVEGITVTTTTEDYQPLNCFGSLKFSNGQGWAFDSDGVTVPNDGTYEISFRIGFISNGQRACPVVATAVNNFLTGDASNFAYIRNSQSLNESACVLTTKLQLTAGQRVGLHAKRSGTVTAAISTLSEDSFFSIEQVAGEKQANGISNINDLSDVDAPSPMIDQGLKWNGLKWIAGNFSNGGGGGGFEVISKEVSITQGSWSANTNYAYTNISIPEVEVGDLCIIHPDPQILQGIQATGGTWEGFAYSISNGLVVAVCRVSNFLAIAPLTKFNIHVIKGQSEGFSTDLDIDVDFYDEFLNVDASDKGKHFNILSPLNYSVILPALDDVELTDIFKFKNLNDSTLKGLFVPVVGEKIENQTQFELFGRGTLALRKKHNENGAFWSIVEISNLFDHVGQGKSKEIAFNDHNGALEIVHDRGYRPIIKIYVADGIGGYSEADVDIDHNENQNSFIVNLEGLNTGFVRYV